MSNTIKLHDDFMEDVRVYINKITELRRKGDYKGAALMSLEFAKAKVAYYEQFLDDKNPNTSTQRIFRDDYNTALRNLGVARDKCLDLGLWED